MFLFHYKTHITDRPTFMNIMDINVNLLNYVDIDKHTKPPTEVGGSFDNYKYK